MYDISRHKQTDRQTDRQEGGQTDRQIGRQGRQATKQRDTFPPSERCQRSTIILKVPQAGARAVKES